MPTNFERNLVREIVTAIIKDNPTLSRDEHRLMYRKEIQEKRHADILEAAINWTFDFIYILAKSSLNPPSMSDVNKRAESRANARKAEDEEVEIIKAVITNRILDMQTMVGKPLRECTGSECIKMGGFFAQIGKTVAANRTVGETLSEHELKILAKGIWNIGENKQRNQIKPQSDDTTHTTIK